MAYQNRFCLAILPNQYFYVILCIAKYTAVECIHKYKYWYQYTETLFQLDNFEINYFMVNNAQTTELVLMYVTYLNDSDTIKNCKHWPDTN